MGHTRNPHRVSDGRARAKLEIRQTDPLEAFDKDTGTPEEDIKPDEPKTSIPANSFNQDGANFLKSDVQPDEVTASVSENSFNRNEANFLEDDMKPDEDQTTMPEDSFNQDDANTLKDDTKPDEASSLDSANTPGKWNTGAAPRCPGQPNNYHPQLKPGARPASANGCGSKNNYKVVPDFSFGPCCDAHDYCYDDCGQTFEACNYTFRDCMDQKCGKVDHWYSKPVYAACIGAADVYSATVEGSFGSKKFKEYNNERCQCVP
ncbi:hypothetical protein CLAFUW4_02271 [Fulvia fulva]|uniref:Uncharacterized protein n=1 Tax=Passalora fulva TaxID=5499 RepID=A0A9Q8P3X2_PASFU|nr:uncharacterized protein CLAFUR5_02262 [Fulvia fulva]KAK4637729.1 hypothetical protein CLAFUR0_02270 [Fulvia fulva]UJO12211.1 hypothetical protein CLAFUR5_02262 [Fulvia fulva]WPV09275.1 hypothetical protein CLAFUW4_02271 [Fulvia fulva]